MSTFLLTQQQIAALDAELGRRLDEMAPPAPPVPADAPVPKPKAAGKSAPGFAAHALLTRLHGVDLCAVPGINVLTAQTLWSELGGNFAAAHGISAVSWGPGRLDLAGVASDGQAWHKSWQNGVEWSPPKKGWQRIGGRFRAGTASR